MLRVALLISVYDRARFRFFKRGFSGLFRLGIVLCFWLSWVRPRFGVEVRCLVLGWAALCCAVMPCPALFCFVFISFVYSVFCRESSSNVFCFLLLCRWSLFFRDVHWLDMAAIFYNSF